MLFAVLVRKAYARNLQYRGAHMLHNVASALFGFIYVSIWTGLGADSSLGEYGVKGMVSYIAFNQASLWITLFITNGLGIEQSVRTGQISLDLMRPVHLFYQTMSREWGQIYYQFLYKFIPIYLLYFFLFSLQIPKQASVYATTALALVLAAYISICINYLIGVAAMWTTESRWLYWVNYAFSMLLSGFFIPLEWLPSGLSDIAFYSPYPYLLYYPTRIYLQMEQGTVLFGSLLWCIGFTLLCLFATVLVRRKLEVQGG
ncbi:ABC transporter permease [Paenibacillus eucommiae]|uniref:ABC-2 type transport system permease protein n=1 Tax=Paenibacillus eucommiae TaxID=1355755 RepID=A0ABS4J0W6_9BACL|nr:ABC-2 family transporter protein [Paenibacillus eucommiae]MBP1992414.1 ABC-2 type transport system permease protein [Paenibacillus eucommiae]